MPLICEAASWQLPVIKVLLVWEVPVSSSTMKTTGSVLITLLAGLDQASASPTGGQGGNPCSYSCTEGGGCEVLYIGLPR